MVEGDRHKGGVPHSSCDPGLSDLLFLSFSRIDCSFSIPRLVSSSLFYDITAGLLPSSFLGNFIHFSDFGSMYLVSASYLSSSSAL